MKYRTLLTLAFVFCWMAYAHASDPSVRAVYGEGVHSFYDGNFQQSHDYLTQVVDIGTDDPRVYYFRGLSALRLGSQTEANEDFKKGATFEAERGNTRSVSRALERIQGPERLLLEQSRSKARLALAKRQEPQLSNTPQSFLSGGRRYSGIGGTESQENLPKPAVKLEPMSADKSAEVDDVAEKTDEAQQMQPLGAEKAQSDFDAFFGNTDEEKSGMAEKTDEAQQMQPLGAEKAQRDFDAFFGNTDEEKSGMAEKTEPQASDTDKKPNALFDDPFGDDPFAGGPRRTDPPSSQPAPAADGEATPNRDSDDPFNFAPRKPTGSNTQRDQIEMQNEMLDAEAADSRDQREAMNERDAAAGD